MRVVVTTVRLGHPGPDDVNEVKEEVEEKLIWSGRKTRERVDGIVRIHCANCHS